MMKMIILERTEELNKLLEDLNIDPDDLIYPSEDEELEDPRIREQESKKKPSGMIRTVIKYTDNKILLNDAEVFETSKTLFPGVYDMELDNYGRFKNFSYRDCSKVFPLMPSTELENIEEYTEKFLSEEYKELCKKTNIFVKTGILLHGEAGIGKSNYINSIVEKAIREKGACVFNIEAPYKLSILSEKLRELRSIQDTLFVIVMEEMDEFFRESGAEGMIKNFMDGINSVDNSLFLATTNYIDKIPKSLTERPSRFKKVLHIKPSPNIEEMKDWLKTTYKSFIDNLTDEECELLHDQCLNKTIDEIKHVLIDYKMSIKGFEEPKRKRLGFVKE